MKKSRCNTPALLFSTYRYQEKINVVQSCSKEYIHKETQTYISSLNLSSAG